MYSALKHEGRRLYELARRGIVVERPPRRVHVSRLELDDYRWPLCAFTLDCSKGTYVRSLVVDIAEALGTLGHVTALRRLAVQPFAGQPMLGLEGLEAAGAGGFDALDSLLLPIERVHQLLERAALSG
jgi:tRNA pseudouridine55 synthase